jgi:hypothetical protein
MALVTFSPAPAPLAHAPLGQTSHRRLRWVQREGRAISPPGRRHLSRPTKSTGGAHTTAMSRIAIQEKLNGSR